MEINEPGMYTLNPIVGNDNENVAYKIKSIGLEEYFIIEYRNKANVFDKTILL